MLNNKIYIIGVSIWVDLMSIKRIDFVLHLYVNYCIDQ